MGSKFAGAGLVAVLAAVAVGAAACNSGGTTATPGASPTSAAPATSDAAPIVTASPGVAGSPTGPAEPTRNAKPTQTAKPAQTSKPGGASGDQMPGGGTLVTITAAKGGYSLVDLRRPTLSVSKKGTPLKFHVIGFDDIKNLQFSLSGGRNLCLDQVDRPVAALKLATCDLKKRSQRFALNPAGSGQFYLHGTGDAEDRFLYYGSGDVASFEVTADFEATRWTFPEQGFEPVD